jgi:hypothetical protein
VDPVSIGSGLTLSGGIFFVFLETSASVGHTKPTKNIELSSAPTKNTELSSENFHRPKGRRKITQSRQKKLFLSALGYLPSASDQRKFQ